MAETILSTAEIEHIIEHFNPFTLDDIGKLEWFKNVDKLCKLYQVAVLEVKAEGPERIKSAMSVQSRIADFTKVLVTVAVWKDKVLSILLGFTPKPEQAFPIYIILYSEVMIIGLLEALLFHGEMFWDLGDMILDLIDYAVEKLATFSIKGTFNPSPVESNMDALTEINQQRSKMSLTICASCITILRYVAENFDKISLSASSRLYTNYDVPLIVASLLNNDAWSLKIDGKVYKFVSNSWREWRCDDPILSHIECQMWLLLRQLLLNPTCDTVYYYSEHRKDNLSLLTRHLYDSVVDQLSPLADLKIWLHRLSLSNPTHNNDSSNPLIMEISENFRDKLLIEYDGKWDDLAASKALVLLYPKEDDIKTIANSLSSSFDGMILLDETVHSCNFCYSKALKRCSKCQKAWYCSRKCQVEHWKLHKSVCCQ